MRIYKRFRRMQQKDQKISPIKQRILEYIDYLGISKREFYQITGISRGTLESKTGITEDIITRFIEQYRNISPEWLIFGTGQMLSHGPEHNEVNEEAGQYLKSCPLCRQKDEIINALKDANYALKLALKHCTEENCKQTGS